MGLGKKPGRMLEERIFGQGNGVGIFSENRIKTGMRITWDQESILNSHVVWEQAVH